MKKLFFVLIFVLSIVYNPVSADVLHDDFSEIPLPPWKSDEVSGQYKLYVVKYNASTGKFDEAIALQSHTIPSFEYTSNVNQVWANVPSSEPEMLPIRKSTISSDWSYSSLTRTRGMYLTSHQDGPYKGVIMYCNYDVVIDGSIYYNGGGYDWSEGDYFVKFLQPRDGFVDNSYLMSCLVHYQVPLLSDDDIFDYQVTISGGDEDYDYGTFNPIYSHEFENIGGMIGEGILSFSRPVVGGMNNITVTVENENLNFSASSTVSVERLIGFVDEDGDGLDDRTGREDANIDKSKDIDLTTGFNGGYSMPVRSDFEDGFVGDIQYGFAFLTWVITYPFYAIGQVFSFFTKAIKDLFTGFNDFVKPINEFVSWLPNELKALVVAVFTLVIVKFALRR